MPMRSSALRELLRSLRGRLVLITVAAATSLIVSIVVQVISHQQTRERLVTLAGLVAAHNRMQFESVEALLTAISLDPILRDIVHPDCTIRFRELEDSLSDFGYSIFGAADADGNVTCIGSELDHPVDQSARPYYANVMERRRFSLGAYRFGALAGETIVVAAYPILDHSGAVRNLVGAGVSVNWLNHFLEGFSAEDDVVVQLVDEEGTVIAQHPRADGVIGQPLGGDLSIDVIRQIGTGTTEFSTNDGARHIAGLSPVDERFGELFAITYLPKPGYFDWLGQESNHPYLFAILIAILIVFAVGLSTHITVRAGFRRVSEVARRLAAGDFAARTDLANYAGEIGGLAKDLDEMAGALQQREHQIASKTRRLEETNKDLEHFAYIASHDLREPLRGIDHLTQWIAEDTSNTLSEESQYNMSRLHTRVEKLHVLLDGLLQYSRASRSLGDTIPVDTGQLIMETIDLLDLPEGFTVAIEGDMPVIRTHSPALRTVFANLLGNSVRHHDRDRGAIVIAASTVGDMVEFTVTDDGPGVPTRSRDRIFDMFQTLNASDAPATGGIGLAIVKRLVETHGGTIQVAAPDGTDRGASFRFSWKAHD